MEDLDKKIQNMELIIAMRVLQESDTKENRNRLINEMMRSRFITPAFIKEEDAKLMAKLKESGEKRPVPISFKVVTARDGKRFLPAFTDTMQYNKWIEKCEIKDPLKKMVMNFEVYAQYILGSGGELSGFIINPFGENLVFPEPMVRNLAMQLQKIKAEIARKKVEAEENGD